MLKAYQLIALSMNKERWASDLWHDVNITETIIDQILEHATGLLPNYISDGHERTHEKEGGWLS